MVASKSILPRVAAVAAVAVALYFFPLFRVVPLRDGRLTASTLTGQSQPDWRVGRPAAARLTVATTLKNAQAVSPAKKFWREKLLPAAAEASSAADVLNALQRDPAAAAKRYAHQADLGGAAYYFVRGAGRVVATEKNQIIVAVDGANGAQVALKVGPLFGNTVRDGTGLLNVNDFPGLAEFNAFSAELNQLVETRVFPAARERATPGASVTFAGCAEAPESVGVGPLLGVVPVEIAAK